MVDELQPGDGPLSGRREVDATSAPAPLAIAAAAKPTEVVPPRIRSRSPHLSCSELMGWMPSSSGIV